MPVASDSARLETLRFPLVYLVLNLHAGTAALTFGSEQVTLPALPLIAGLPVALWFSIARAAVPVFFLTAGFLFFSGFDGSLAGWRGKLRRRARSLLVPYLVWNGLAAALFLAVRRIPALAPYLNASGVLADASPLAIADAVLGVTQYPVVYPFWFIRDLMVLTVLALPIHAILVRTGWMLPLLLCICWALRVPVLPLAMVTACTFFVLGGAFAMHGVSMFAWERRPILFALLFLATATVDLSLAPGSARLAAQMAATAAAISLILCLPRFALRHAGLAQALTALGPASFFVFAAHEPMTTFARKLLFRELPPTAPVAAAVMLLVPLGIAIVTTSAFFLLRRLMPALLAVLTGDRLAPRATRLPIF